MVDSWQEYRKRKESEKPNLLKARPSKLKPVMPANIKPIPEPPIRVEWPLADDALISRLEYDDPALATQLEGQREKLATHYAKVVKLEFSDNPDEWRPKWQREEADLINELAEMYYAARNPIKHTQSDTESNNDPTRMPTIDELKRRQPKDAAENLFDGEARIEATERTKESREALLKAVEDFREEWKTYLEKSRDQENSRGRPTFGHN